MKKCCFAHMYVVKECQAKKNTKSAATVGGWGPPYKTLIRKKPPNLFYPRLTLLFFLIFFFSAKK